VAFTDSFTRADENLEASANWTRVDGAAGAAAVRSNQLAQLSSTNTAYQCPDQSSADHYSQAVTKVSGAWTGFMAIRLTDSNNFIGTRPGTNVIELYKRVSGTFTSLGSASASTAINAVYYVEGSGNNLTVKVDGVTKLGPTSETAHNTVTRSGIVVRTTLNPTLDDFESGALAASVTITGNPITWQWETNNVIAKENVDTTPIDWRWEIVAGTVKENINSNPVDLQWFVTTGSIQEGATTIISGNTIAWEWQSGTASFVQKIQGTPVNWEWFVTTGKVTEKINTTPVNWEWQITSGQILGTETIDANPINWQWEVTQGNVVYLQPQISGTLGGKKNKKVKLPYYEGKDYESRIEVEEIVRDDNRVVADLLDIRGDVVRKASSDDIKQNDFAAELVRETGFTVGDLVQKLAPQTPEVSVIEFPQIAESEGFDEEAAVIMLLLAA
jgi:hypothetical protein